MFCEIEIFFWKESFFIELKEDEGSGTPPGVYVGSATPGKWASDKCAPDKRETGNYGDQDKSAPGQMGTGQIVTGQIGTGQIGTRTNELRRNKAG